MASNKRSPTSNLFVFGMSCGRLTPAAVQPRPGCRRHHRIRLSNQEEIRRTIALVVDDLGLSADSIIRIRESLKKWVEYEMQPGDLVSVVRTNAGIGALQQFTNDKRLLYSAIDLDPIPTGTGRSFEHLAIRSGESEV